MSRGDFMRLKEIRKSRGTSQLKLAMDLNTNQNTQVVTKPANENPEFVNS